MIVWAGCRWMLSFCNNFMLSKRRFWKAEPRSQNACSKHFSGVTVPDLGVETSHAASSRVKMSTPGLCDST